MMHVCQVRCDGSSLAGCMSRCTKDYRRGAAGGEAGTVTIKLTKKKLQCTMYKIELNSNKKTCTKTICAVYCGAGDPRSWVNS